MNVKYEGDNTPFLTREETEQMTLIFHGMIIYIVAVVEIHKTSFRFPEDQLFR